MRAGVLIPLLVGSLACADDGGETTEVVDTEYGEICVRRADPPAEPVRVPWEECENDSSHSHFYPYWIYHGGGHSAPPVGSRITPGSGTVTRPPSGSIARPPSSGGFGTRIATIGG